MAYAKNGQVFLYPIIIKKQTNCKLIKNKFYNKIGLQDTFSFDPFFKEMAWLGSKMVNYLKHFSKFSLIYIEARYN